MKSILIFGIYVLKIVSVLSEEFYPKSEVIQDGLWYMLSRSKQYQEDAQKICQVNGGTLANPQTSYKSDVITRYLRSTIKANDLEEDLEYVWIGLKRFPPEKLMGTWSDGTKWNGLFKNWAPNEPRSNNEHCVQIWIEKNLQWDDVGCFKKIKFLCEFKGQRDFSPESLESDLNNIIQFAELSVPNKHNLEVAANMLEKTVNVNNDTFLQTQSTLYQETRRALNKMMRRYDVINNGDMNFTNDILSISIQGIYKDKGVLFGDTILLNSTVDEVYSTIYLPRSTVNWAFGNSDIEDTPPNRIILPRKKDKSEMLASTFAIYRKPSLMFYSNSSNSTSRDLVVDKKKINFKEFSTVGSVDNKFGDSPVIELEPSVVSDVISAEIINVKVKDLEDPITITSSVPKNKQIDKILNLKEKFEYACVHWDEAKMQWLQDGCHLYKTINNDGNFTTVICHCNHLTNFAVLLKTSYFFAPKFLSYITIVGCILSSVGLLLTALTNLLFRQLRSKTSQQILIHVCFNMAIVNIFFLIGIDRTEEPRLCFVTAAILHFFILTTWFWMFFEAVFLFLSLVVPNSGRCMKKHIVVFGILVSYAFPAITVGVTVEFSGIVYMSEKYCWLSLPALKYSVLIPVGCLLCFNFGLFIMIMYSITCRSKIFRKNANLDRVSQALKRAICMTFILGIPWAFGFFMLLSQDHNLNYVMTILFTVSNALQGITIFIFFCIRQENVRKLWKDCLCVETRYPFKQNANTSRPTKKSEIMELNTSKSNQTCSKQSTTAYRSNWTARF